jgi:hypothetical protein
MPYEIGSEDYLSRYRSVHPIPFVADENYLGDQEYQFQQLEETRLNLDPADDGGWEALAAEYAILAYSLERPSYAQDLAERSDALYQKVKEAQVGVDAKHTEILKSRMLAADPNAQISEPKMPPGMDY